ncbi:probable methyltransferase TARBP1 isoform X2 [Athalia rosae]|nr:probable methyltransferase TARBP1 isoform X2 [Athalia rosae]
MLKDFTDCQLLTFILPRIIKLIDQTDTLTKIWDLIFKHLINPAEALNFLCLTSDTWFSLIRICHINEPLIEQAMKEPFWVIISKGLSSSSPQQRKQALYLIKRVIEVAKESNTLGLDLTHYKVIKPLVLAPTIDFQGSLKKNVNNFLLILEALEEKQKHLVMPVFPLLESMIDETFSEATPLSGIDIAWIRCAYTRILKHENNAVVKWGLLSILKLEAELYDNDFLVTVLDVLNNTYIWEHQANEIEPTVVSELTKLLNSAESKNSDLVTRFLTQASEMTWGPVALFYVIHTLSMVEQKCSIWKEPEWNAIKALAKSNLNMHCRTLRIGSQIKLLQAATHFAIKSSDLITVAKSLEVFSNSEALTRGQLAWKRISLWISETVTKAEATRFLDDFCSQMANEKCRRDLSMKSFSLLLLLFHDGGLILDTKECPALLTLHNLLNCLIGADSRPYGDTDLRHRSIELLGHLLQSISTNDCVLLEFVAYYADATLRFIFKLLRKTSDVFFVDNIYSYVLVVQKFFSTKNSYVSKAMILNHIERFELETLTIIEDGQYSSNVQRFFGIMILYICLKATSTKLKNYKFIELLHQTYQSLSMQSSGDTEKTTESCNLNRNLNGKIAAEYYKYVAELFYEYVKDVPANEWVANIDWIEQVSYLAQVGNREIFVPLVRIMAQIFYKGSVTETEINDFKSVLNLCWKSTFELSDCRLATEEIIYLIFSTPFLELKETRELAIKYTGEIILKSDKIPRLSLILLKGLQQAKGDYLSNFYEAIISCLLHGTVPRRDQKVELQARSFVVRWYRRSYPNHLSSVNININAAIRANAVILLHKMIIDEPLHAVRLLPMMIAVLNEKQNKRYFGDSQIHRQKNRIMQVLLVLQPILEQVETATLYTLIRDNMLTESSQPSIKIMQEWLLIKIYLENEAMRLEIWDLFDQAQEKRVGSLCSVVSIVYHVSRLLSAELQPDFINLALEHILPCCMSQQFNVRLYAQVIASKLYDFATEMSYLTVTEKHGELYKALKKSLKYGNLMTNSLKLQDDFYFTLFNPEEDYSLQTLFDELPRLSNVSSDECIPPEMFGNFGFKESNSHPLKLLNRVANISLVQVSTHILKSAGSAGPLAEDFIEGTHCSNDIQKKFIPWKSMIPNEDDLSEVSSTSASHQNPERENEIILVASLVDKLPNLGGLSRTCEILGVKEFVLASIKYTEDKEFQSVSVSAEKLIPLIEVKPHQLQQYLSEKKSLGYRLVGAEQTVNSTNLANVKFHKKTVLLLGNEKAGIPVNLISLLDECVEIPQVGVVRSFNVHVTGAICLWEYFKQHRTH